MFNKLGRYHIEYQEIISMYIQILKDLDLFNSFINKSANAIITEHIKPPTQSKLPIRKDAIVQPNNLPTSSPKIYITEQDEKVKHFFLYVN